LSSQMTPSRWQRLMADLQLPADLQTYAALHAAYAERHRHYHTVRHLDHCLSELDSVRHLAVEPAEVEIALWFHDAIYNPYASNNEEASAQWAERLLGNHPVDPARIGRIRDHILATRHASPVTSPDSQLVVDIDLAILGTGPDTYREFEVNVRKEYAWVPAPVFRRKRAEILQSFLDRPTLYHTSPLRNRYESAARSNLLAAITVLRS
jgi:predicted metal-dependent HD superfamily phosphohydrolase